VASTVASYEYRHLVSLEETNLLGNVYYVHHLRWQGRCREFFLRDHAPEVLEALGPDRVIVTTQCHCDYLAELRAFDEVVLRMRLGPVVQHRLTLFFEYWRQEDGAEELVARGLQELAWMEKREGRLAPARVPDRLLTAIDGYRVQVGAER
jgi:enediyne biosynthesis thioesterase